jgi:vacuolar-type H+-ATPase subunit F/Vma7
MDSVIYIGDAIHAAGWRLAGVRQWSPEPGRALAEQLAALPDSVQLVLLSPAIAEGLDPTARLASLRSLKPLFLLLPAAGDALPEVIGRVRAQLGMDA